MSDYDICKEKILRITRKLNMALHHKDQDAVDIYFARLQTWHSKLLALRA